MNTLIKIQIESQTVNIGDSFVQQKTCKTVYEIHGIFPPGMPNSLYVFRHKEDFSLFISRQAPVGRQIKLLRSLKYFGQIYHHISDEQNIYEVKSVNRYENGPFVVSQIVGGVFYNHDLLPDQQKFVSGKMPTKYFFSFVSTWMNCIVRNLNVVDVLPYSLS